MNKRPHSGLGLPAKPMGPPQGGPTPPYPAGQPPQQQQYTPDQHAAAWAAYYQANPQAAQQAGYNGGGAGGAAAPADASAPNPYANYGYGAGASHAQGYSGQQQQQQQQGYQNQNRNQNQSQNYNQPQQGHNYQQGYGQGGYNANAGYNQPQQGYGNWGGQQSPPGAGGYQAPQNPTAGGYTPQNNQHYGQAQGQGSYSPSPRTPGFRPPQNRPYQPQPGGPGPDPGRGGHVRPPAGGPHPPGGPSPGGPGGPGGFPPAKRPRFDGPGGGSGGGGGAMHPRPPNLRPPPGYGSGLARPMNDRGGGGGGRGGAPPPPIPRIGFGVPQQRPQRGGMRGGGPMGRGGGMMGRGTMRQRDQREMRPPRTQRVEASPQQARKRKDKEAKEARTTMTDFRIVGIEVKGLDWSWGLVGQHVVDVKDEKTDDVNPELEVKDEATNDKSDKPDEKKPEPESVVKPEPEDDTKPEPEVAEKEELTDAADEKRGEKRKARKSSVDGDEAQSPKKRSFILTHNKVNAPGDGPSPESNQNRFRIYFESPPELDRVPKSARRNPNKRWRRESTALDEAVIEEAQTETADAAETSAPAEQLKEDTTTEPVPTDANGDKPAEEAPTEAKAEATSDSAEPTAEAETAEAAVESSSDSAAPAEKEAPAKDSEGMEEAGDVSMVTDLGPVEGDAAEGEEHEHTGLTGAEASAAEMEAALAESAQNTASAYGSRQKPRARGWSTSSIGSDAETDITALAGDVAQPSVNRVSVLYEESTRRLVFDASVVQKIRIFRSEGRIEVDLYPPPPMKGAEVTEGDKDVETKEAPTETELPKGVLVETYDPAEQRFMAVSREKLDSLWKDDEDRSVPPLHRVFGCTATTASTEPLTLTVFLNKKKPLSEPKWCRTNQADEWLYEQFGRRAASESGWRGKLEIMDPDAPPTLANILDTWKGGSNVGTTEQRSDFTASLLASPNDLLEILIRLTRGDRNPTAAVGTGPTSANGPLATAIRPDSPYASHQTHVSLAILAMYRLTTDYAEQAGKTAALNDQIADIIRSLPAHMIHRSLEGLYKEWLAERRG